MKDGITAVDIVSAPLQQLRADLAAAGTSAQLVQADLLAWSPDRPFNAIYEQTCLCALEPPLWPAYEARLASWLRPGGVLLALFMQTG